MHIGCPQGFVNYEESKRYIDISTMTPTKIPHKKIILPLMPQSRLLPSQGLAVTGILYGTPSWANAGKSCAGSEWCSPNNATDYARFVRFIANRYNCAQGNGRVVDFVIGNEVDQKAWYNCGCSTSAAWEQDYANNFNAAYDVVKAEQTNARILMSFDHTWSPAFDSSSQIGVAEFIPAVAALVGTRSWQVALHPYSIVVGDPTFSPDDINAGYTTFGDIGVIVGMLQQQYPGTAAAAVELTESGFDSNPSNGNSEAGQKTGLCNSFYNVVGTPGIDNYVYHRLIDNSQEGGLLLGLWDVNQNLKPSWTTWALANRAGHYSCGFSANNYTTLTRSYDSSRGHWASSRLAPSGFSEEHSFNLLRSQPLERRCCMNAKSVRAIWSATRSDARDRTPTWDQ